MQRSKKNVISPELLRPIVVRSLRGSKVREKIVDYLFDISPSGSYISDIAYNVETSPSNVIGALRGMNLRYKHDESLISLNIVELIKKNNTTDLKLYRLTEFGKEILESIKSIK
jgi:predicted transcriptional regulator with HTH domain